MGQGVFERLSTHRSTRIASSIWAIKASSARTVSSKGMVMMDRAMNVATCLFVSIVVNSSASL